MRNTAFAVRSAVALLLATLAAPANALLAPGDYVRTLTFGGIERDFRLHVPPGYDGAQVPLVLDIHGFTSNADQQRAISGWIAVADREGFLLAHPNGVNNAWNAGLCCGNAGIDDVGFAVAVVDAIAAEAAVDRQRVYATGLSNGGAMSQRLACDAADVFAAVAPMAFPVPARPLAGCRPSRPIATLTVMGITDVLVAYDGGAFPSAAETFDYWHDVAACRGSKPDVVETKGQSRCETYTRCADDVQVCLCSVVAREFPGQRFSGHVLYLNPDLMLAEVAWAFLSRFRLPPATPTVAGELRGTQTVSVRGAGSGSAPTVWRLGLGDGTWWAEDDDGLRLAGAARKRGAGRWSLALSTDAERSLAARIAEQASAVAGVDVGTPSARGPARLAVTARGSRLKLAGQLKLAPEGGGRGLAVRVRLEGAVGAGR